MGQASFQVSDVGLAPFPFENKDEMSDKLYYGISFTADKEEYVTFFNELHDSLVDKLTPKTKEFFALKKPKTKKIVKASFKELLAV